MNGHHVILAVQACLRVDCSQRPCATEWNQTKRRFPFRPERVEACPSLWKEDPGNVQRKQRRPPALFVEGFDSSSRRAFARGSLEEY